MVDFKNGSLIKLKLTNSIPNGLTELLIPGEEIIGRYQAIRDYVVFTNKRIISANV